MTDTSDTDLTVFIAREGNELVTDSRAVAIAFGKRHGDVLRAIERRALSARPTIAEHAQRNFALGSYADAQGQRRPMYRMTAKGLSELAMGFSGEDACEVRIRFVEAFEAVAQRLAERERSITERLHDLARREAPSELKGRVGSMLMHERRREKPDLAAERAALELLVQPSLLH